MPLAIYVLGLGIFSMTTSEFMVSGLMPTLADHFDVSIPQVGYLVTTFAVAMVVGGPLLTLALLKVPRKKALMTLIAIFFVAQVAGALAQTYYQLMGARFVTGIASSAFFGVSLAICMDIVGPKLRGRASSVVLGGLMVGTVLGLPLATVVNQYFGWRASFGVVAGLVLLTGLISLKVIPVTPKPESVSVRHELRAFRNGPLWAAFTTSALIIGAVFAAFSYFVPIFTELGGFSTATVPVLLAVYGLATVVGNAIVGRVADTRTMSTMVIGLTVLTIALAVFALNAGAQPVAVACAIAIGLVGVTMNPAMVTRVMRAANDRPLVNTAHTSVINIGIMGGSWLGGLAIASGYGLVSPLWVGSGLAALGLISLLPFLRSSPAPAPETALHATAPPESSTV
ncbi:MFS transporter [Actinorhabdospora filicis]|uniref:MFS transporter n=1 Tax=Actinorhabdospora filicis TaxID=1785913 RepID=A0A9W6SKB2_9ACTN|nr:MFS transporter [Actinorhabdospora filicis]GLZ78580.1 MFS transporter [Actinorhabdospora filicis]